MRKSKSAWPVGERPNQSAVVRYELISLLCGLVSGGLSVIASLGAPVLAIVVLTSVIGAVVWGTSVAVHSAGVTTAFLIMVLAAGLSLVGHVPRAPMAVAATMIALAGSEAAAMARRLNSIVPVPSRTIATRAGQAGLAVLAGGVLGMLVLVGYALGLPRSAVVATIAAVGAITVIAAMSIVASAGRVALHPDEDR